ncbi:nucleotide exchange factor GrpE [soil metagenome]
MKIFKKKTMQSKENKNTVDEPQTDLESGIYQETGNSEALHEGLPDAEQEEAGQLAKTELELSEARDKYLRLYSDFDNYKKRINRERIELIGSANQDLMASLLPMLDDMERAMKAMSEAKDVEAVKEGIRLVFQKMKTITEAKGLKAMNAAGKDFDVDLHDAIANVPVKDEAQKGKVIEEIEKGYYLNDKVIRHAKVIVGN